MHKSKFTKSAKKNFDIEAKEIKSLSKLLDKNFDKVCNTLKKCKGRIITLGVGKSGHIAHKISATLSSTQSPSFFINAAEALHGDLGAIDSDDVILIISYSGQSEEILNVLPRLKEIGCTLISITGKRNSEIAEKSNLTLILNIEKEACPLDLAPTASTTATLALGDAIALAIFESKGLKSNDFARSHPGGLLGKRLTLKVKDLMHLKRNLPLINKETYLSKALIEISKKNLGLALVVDAKKELIGIFTDGDLRRCINKKIDIHKTKINSVMSKKGKSIDESELAVEAMKIMESNEIYSLVVLDDSKKLSGIIRMHDLLKSGLL
jgi:arabinose-5-phosphate isomerase